MPNDFGIDNGVTRLAATQRIDVVGVFDVNRKVVQGAVVTGFAGDFQASVVSRGNVHFMSFVGGESKATISASHPDFGTDSVEVPFVDGVNDIELYFIDGVLEAKYVVNSGGAQPNITEGFGVTAAVGAGDCCAAGGNGSPGCDDAECEATVCACDPFCCATEWDGFCANDGFPAGSGCGAAVLCEVCMGGGGGGNDPGADLCADAVAISGAGTFDFDNSAAEQDGVGNALCLAFGSNQVDNDVWFCWTSDCDGVVTLDTCGGQTTVDTKIAVYDGCACPSGSGILACNDDTCGLQSSVSWTAAPGATYLIRVGTFPGATGGTGTFTITGPCGGGGGGGGGADLCADAEAISGEGLFDFDNGGTGTDGVGDPLCLAFGSNQIDNDVWFCWTAPCTAPVRIETCGLTAVDTKIAVYNGCACPSGSGILACNDDTCGLQSRVDFDAISGNTYLLRIGTFPGATGGAGQFSIECVVSKNICEQPADNCQDFATDNASQSNTDNFRSADDFVPASSGSITSICWWGAYLPSQVGDTFVVTYHDDAGGIPGAVIGGPFTQGAGLAVSGPVDTGQLVAGVAPIWEYTGTHAGVSVTGGDCYWISITNDTVSGTTNWFWEWSHAGNSRVAVDATPGTPFGAGDIQLGNDFAFCLSQALGDPAGCLPPPAANDDCADADPISGEGAFPFDNSDATTDGAGDPLCLAFGSDQVDNDVWFCWTASCTGSVLFTTCGQTGVDTKIAVYDGCSCPSGSGILACNDDACGLQSSVQFDAVAGNQYLLRVGTFPGAAGGAGTFSLTCVAAPANDLCADAIALDVPSQTPGTTSFATPDPNAPFCGTSVSAPGVWYTVSGTGTTMTASFCPQFASTCCQGNATPGCDDPDCQAAVCACDPFCCETQWDGFCADTGFPAGSGCGAAVLCSELCGGGGGGGSASYDAKLNVYCGDCDDLICVTGNDDSCGLSSEVSWCAAANTTYHIFVQGFGGQTGDFVLALSENGVACSPTVGCPSDVITGACCFSGGICEELEAGDCSAAGGEYQGDFSSCEEVECPACDAPPTVDCGVEPWNGGGPGRWVVTYGASSSPDCGELGVTAVIDTGCELIPVENGEVFKINCNPNGNPNAACFHHYIGGAWDVLHIVTHQYAVLRVTATDEFGNETVCEYDVCDLGNGNIEKADTPLRGGNSPFSTPGRGVNDLN